MPWLALPLGSAAGQALTQKYGVMTIPKLVVLDERGETITADGCDAIAKLGAAGFPWTNFRSSVCSKCIVS